MTEQEGFDKALVERCANTVTTPQDFQAGWQAALEWARSQQEPVQGGKFFALVDKETRSHVKVDISNSQAEIFEHDYQAKMHRFEGSVVMPVYIHKRENLYTHPAPVPDVSELISEVEYLIQVIDDSEGIAWSRNGVIQDWEDISQLDDVKKALAKREGTK